MADLRIRFDRGWVDRIVPALNKGLAAGAAVAADATVKVLSQHSSAAGASPAGSPPGYDTSNLRNSVASASPDSLGTPLHAAYGTAVFYGRVLEFGGFITPKRAKYLAIPVDRKLAKKVMGSQPAPRSVYTWDGFINVHSLRDNPLLQFIPSKKKGTGGVLVLKQAVEVWRGKNTKGKLPGRFPAGSVVFVLKRRVSIKARPWIRRAVDDNANRAAIRAAFVDAAAKFLKLEGLSA